ncbi:VOC family protein [Ruania zhangjianzhongii]|uniref:VOC family protein n=1 Tax=Ruania zhangjianzhongii TaxID=2603206 RepID=UPI0011CCDBDD|nr:VOC family protein [Ruania zhangjianzhongii]
MPHLDSIVIDAQDPARLAGFWAVALDAPVAYQGDDGTRLLLPEQFELFLDFVPVSERLERPHRLHLDLYGGAEHTEVARQLTELGAAPVDIGQGQVPWVVLTDPDDYAFCVLPGQVEGIDPGSIMAVTIEADDKDAAFAFWREATGWLPAQEEYTLRHPSGAGLLLAFFDSVEPKRGKNPMHLDLRTGPEEDYDAVLRGLLDRGATLAEHDWGQLPWTVLIDPGGNECCLLRAD